MGSLIGVSVLNLLAEAIKAPKHTTEQNELLAQVEKEIQENESNIEKLIEVVAYQGKEIEALKKSLSVKPARPVRAQKKG